MYSQHDEEKKIAEFFGDTIGKFLDVGAYDGFTFSNTRRLAEIGWNGICVEPSPPAFMALLRLYKDNPKIQLVNCAVDKVSHLVRFYDCGGDLVSSIDLDHRAKWEKDAGCTFSEIFVKTVTFKDLFDALGYDFDFISLDVEGKNFELFQEIAFQNLTRLKIICVEYDNKAEQMCNIAGKFGFRKLSQYGENLILSR